MAKLDLTKYGITGTTEVVHNPSYEQLFANSLSIFFWMVPITEI